MLKYYHDVYQGAILKAGNKMLEMHKFCTTNLKLIKKEEDRKIINEITQTRIFTGLTIKEMATIMRVYRELKHPPKDPDDYSSDDS